MRTLALSHNDEMAMTVADVLSHPALRTTLLAGAGGVEGGVLWAHSCDEPRPWEWMGAGELLMTAGRNIPADADGQVAFLRRLAEAHLAGVTIAENMGAPDLAARFLAAADELAFPVLRTAYEVPWALIARTVAEATSRSAQTARIMRVYEAFRRATLAGCSDEDSLGSLEREVGALLTVVDVAAGEVLIPVENEVPDSVVNHIRGLCDVDMMPGVTRLNDGNLTHVVLPLHDATEVLVATMSQDADIVVLQHAAAIASTIAARVRIELREQLEHGTNLLARTAQGVMNGESVLHDLARFGLGAGPWRTLLLEGEAVCADTTLIRLRSRGLPALVARLAGDVALVVREESLDAVVETCHAGRQRVTLGVSDLLTSQSRFADAVREATWAVEAARDKPGRTARYGRDWPLFLPRTVSEATHVVDAVLGDLLAYDTEKGSELVRSLEVWFSHNRSWQEASKELFIHKQTLVYRIRRIREITGRDVDDLTDVSELHMALRCRRLLRHGDMP